jgi:hypothetical protein
VAAETALDERPQAKAARDRGVTDGIEVVVSVVVNGC